MSAATTPGPTLAPRGSRGAAGRRADTLRHYERKGCCRARRAPAAGIAAIRRNWSTACCSCSARWSSASPSTSSPASCASGSREPPCRAVRDLVAARLGDLEARLRQLTALRRELRHLLVEWDRTLATTPPGQPANLLHSLAGRAAIAPGAPAGLVRRRAR